MLLKSIELNNFRNYEYLKLDFCSNINIFYGKNAQGKTNLLEAIYFLGITKSHRTFFDQDLIMEGNDFFKISASIINDYKYDLKIEMQNGKKKCYIDDKIIRVLSNYIGKFRVTMFFPEDLNIIKGLPGDRRDYFDTEISQHSKKYYEILIEVNKMLKNRNNLLKDAMNGLKIDNVYLDVLTKFLINKMVFIYHSRKKYIERVNEVISGIFFSLTGNEDLIINYKTDVNLETFDNNFVDNQLEKLFVDNRRRELHVGSTVVGCQHDEFEFILKGKDLKKFGSQGQQRMAVIALKLASIEICKKYDGIEPILLLDDVFSELDFYKKNSLLKYIENNVQTFITTTDLSNLDEKILVGAKIFHIDNGEIIDSGEVKING